MSERNVSGFGFEFSPKLVIILVVVAILGFAAFQSIYIVDQTE